MKYALFILIVLFLSSGNLKAQEIDIANSDRNGIYIEYYILTHAFNSAHFSLNYERVFGKIGNTCLRAGAYPDFRSTVSFPITFSWIFFPAKNQHLEIGLGIVYRIEHYQGNYYDDLPAAMFPLMYRYQGKYGLFFRGGVNLWYSWPVLLSPSFSLGYKF